MTPATLEARRMSGPARRLDLGHPQVGGLVVSLTHRETGTVAKLLKYPGGDVLPPDCTSDPIDIRFSDAAASDASTSRALTEQRLAYPRDAACRAVDALARFNGESLAAHGNLLVTNAASGNAGTLHEGCLSWSGPALFGDPFASLP